MNETPMNPQTKKWAKIFVVGLVVILIIILLVSLSGKNKIMFHLVLLVGN